ncbi:MAG: riboflavin synthase [Spirulina sp. SIO3F2]|nr:riboflavin synthase [Spirulina sp. SIO3F2]
MFTGLIQSQGIVALISTSQLQITVVESPDVILDDLALGDSVAVDGVCLTVEKILPGGFIATISPETIRRTCLGVRTESQMRVNLETSLRVGSKLGGHFVTGHVDGLGCLMQVKPTQTAWEMTFGAIDTAPDPWAQVIAPYLAPKGSITVNGISLTVAECDRLGTTFTVAVIPHTYEQTNLAQLRVGDWVNLEGDILSKYVERLLNRASVESTPVDLAFLTAHGYL